MCRLGRAAATMRPTKGAAVPRGEGTAEASLAGHPRPRRHELQGPAWVPEPLPSLAAGS